MTIVDGVLALLGAVIAGSAGGWVSTLLTNRAAKMRQRSDHDHTRHLAEERIAVETAAALRTQRVELYLTIMEVSARLRNDLQRLGNACRNSRVQVNDERAQHLESATAAFTTTRDDLFALIPRITLIAGPEVREESLAMCNLVSSELPQTEINSMVMGAWSYDEDGTERRAVAQWWQENQGRMEALSDRLHEAMRNDVQQAPDLPPTGSLRASRP